MYDFFVTWRKIVRCVWRLPSRTRCNILPLLMNTHDISLQLLSRFKSFYMKCLQSNNFLVNNFSLFLPHSRSSVAYNRRLLLSQAETPSHSPNNILTLSAICLKELCNVRDNVLDIDNFSTNDVIQLINLFSLS